MNNTPGPWRYTPDDGSYVTDIVEPAAGQRIICQIHGDPNTSEIAANGVLIAAAPQLLWLVQKFIGGAALMDDPDLLRLVGKAELFIAQLQDDAA